MSVLGSHLASSVAPANAQARQVSSRQRSEAGDTPAQLARLRKEFESHLQALEESERVESPAHLRVDSQLPQHQSPNQQTGQPKRRPRTRPAQTDDAAVEPVPPSGPPAAPDNGLYRHLDIQA